jgi:AraC-like DNA-binding protein
MADDIDERGARGVAVTRREGSPPWRIDAANHARTCLHVVVRGSFFLSGDEHRAVSVEAGDIVLLDAAPRGATPKLHCVSGGAEGEKAEILSAEYASKRTSESANRPIHLSSAAVERDAELTAILGLLRAALRDDSPGSEELARSLLDPLRHYVMRCHQRAQTLSRTADARLARAIRLMEASLAKRLTVADLAKAAGMSRAAFARRFLAELGVTPLRFLADLRMARAARLLAESDAGLAAIAAEIGYESEFAFSRAFKRYAGEAPGVYRRRHQRAGASFRVPPVRAAA